MRGLSTKEADALREDLEDDGRPPSDIRTLDQDEIALRERLEARGLVRTIAVQWVEDYPDDPAYELHCTAERIVVTPAGRMMLAIHVALRT